ncbi:hypothetical protein [Mycoplasmopsis pullorum]|uniref:hypothetical protein n=1 Tax=Mycoplasmopsis pullorum TaxID=48003 RepID=UPI0012ED3C9D|nr:hypothetical protein [Mycoplasmopsis pullorum]
MYFPIVSKGFKPRTFNIVLKSSVCSDFMHVFIIGMIDTFWFLTASIIFLVGIGKNTAF